MADLGHHREEENLTGQAKPALSPPAVGEERYSPPIRRVYCHGVLAAAGLVLAKPSPAAALAGTLLVLLGPAIRMWAAGVLEKGGGLCTDGPYRLVRHPQYLGSLVSALGFAVMTNVIWGWAILFPMFVVLYLVQIASEERGLHRRHGEAYGEYVARVPMLLPRVARVRSVNTRSWRLARVLANREQYHVLTTLTLMVLFVLKGQGGW